MTKTKLKPWMIGGAALLLLGNIAVAGGGALGWWRGTTQTSVPMTATASHPVHWDDTTTVPNMRYSDGTNNNYVAACVPTTTGDYCAWNGSGWVRGAGTGVINVKDAPYNAVGDGTTDDTAAIQAAINMLGTSGGAVYFPDGTYKIASAINVPQISGVHIFGSSRGGVTIKQATTNTPIFSFDYCDSHSFTIEGMTFTWSSAQPAANTSAVALYFSGANGSGLDGYYNFTVRDVAFSNGFRGMASNPAAQISVWGWQLNEFRSDATMSGGTVHLVPSPSVGQPNVRISDGYMRGDAATEPLIQISDAHPALFDHLELENGTVGPGFMPAVIECGSCNGVLFQSVQVEAVTITATGYRILIADNSQAVYDGVQLDPINISAGVTAYGIQSNSGNAIATARGVVGGMGTVGGGATYYLLSGNFDQVNDIMWDPSGIAGTALIDPSSLSGTGLTTVMSPMVIGPGYITLGDGSSASVSTAGTGAIRYNNTTHTIQQSVNGGAWVDIGSGGGSTGNWTFSGNNADLTGAATMGIGLTTATAVSIGSGSHPIGFNSTALQFTSGASLSAGNQGATGTTGLTIAPNIADGAGGTALLVNNTTTLSSGVKMVRFQNNGTDEFVIYGGGALATPNGIFDTTLSGGFALLPSGSLVYGSIKPSGNNIIHNGGTGAYWGSTWSAAYYTMPQSITAAATTTVNPTLGSYVKLNLQSATNVTSLTVSAGTDGQELIVEVTQPAAGTAATVPTTWTNVNFPGGTFTNTATLGKHDEITMTYNGTTSHWNVRSVALNETN